LFSVGINLRLLVSYLSYVVQLFAVAFVRLWKQHVLC